MIYTFTFVTFYSDNKGEKIRSRVSFVLTFLLAKERIQLKIKNFRVTFDDNEGGQSQNMRPCFGIECFEPM